MIYLDTGCLLKLYYPEPESETVAAAVAGEVIVFTPFHELETVTAMQLKVFRGEARHEQALAATALVTEDLAVGKLVGVVQDWPAAFREVSLLAQAHAAKIGCRSLDILHCALAKNCRRRCSFRPTRGRLRSRVRRRCACWRFEFFSAS